MKTDRVILFTCNGQAFDGMEAAGREGRAYSVDVRPIKLMCLGGIDPGIILKSFAHGAAGVLLLGCPPEACGHDFGFDRARAACRVARELLRLLGFSDHQLHIDHVAADDGRAFARKVGDFVAGLKSRGQGSAPPLTRGLFDHSKKY